ncbi:hypothetical protein BC939DRAFT_468534 [Gamsiella multidivaricata]|uniref:uncharacterized protein n=1 Tax=Gamsiella multidivaricata TaxID=101098 RepID=UPI002220CF8D|nr:uncharacterized protein BC939DRAFT_468534 [Gamsiella multidivaricata]KAG0363940.1 hypothetical protein BGZ54_007958 [Gamsiella multidivaricata]KAI7816589.1 hypothetical protein BC939DRAFT_468534 [Gamsiella multidivaricata]
MPRINPLDHPEILFAVGECIPVFQRQSADFKYTPQTLLRCCRVSKFWRKILLPFLWRVHDAQAMDKVPMKVLTMYSHHFRWFYTDPFVAHYSKLQAPIYTQLQFLIMTASFSPAFALQLIGANKDLQRLKLYNIRPFEEMPGKPAPPQQTNDPSANEKEEGAQAPVNPRTIEPLAHVRTTLQELSLHRIKLSGSDLLQLLRPFAQGSLQSLTLGDLSGTNDLGDLTLENVKYLDLCDNNLMEPSLEHIVGHCPALEHLELIFKDINAIKDLIHIMQGTLEVETKKEKIKREQEGRKRPQWSRPQLKILHLFSHPLPQLVLTNRVSNNPKVLALLRACSSAFNHSKTGYQGSLRELNIQLWVLDDNARKAIEMHRESLEVLKIRILIRNHGHRLPIAEAHQGQEIRRLLRVCHRLRKFEFWDMNWEADVSTIMEDMMKRKTDSNIFDGDDSSSSEKSGDDISGVQTNIDGRQRRELKGRPTDAIRNAELEILVLKAGLYLISSESEAEEEDERMYPDVPADAFARQDGTCAWKMPKQNWNPRFIDGVDNLLNVRWHSFELFEETDVVAERENEGGELIGDFLRFLGPWRALKKLELGQLKFIRAENERAIFDHSDRGLTCCSVV